MSATQRRTAYNLVFLLFAKVNTHNTQETAIEDIKYLKHTFIMIIFYHYVCLVGLPNVINHVNYQYFGKITVSYPSGKILRYLRYRLCKHLDYSKTVRIFAHCYVIAIQLGK